MWHNKYMDLLKPLMIRQQRRVETWTKCWIQNQPFKSLAVKRHRVWTWWICPAKAPWSCNHWVVVMFFHGKLSPQFKKKNASSEKEKVAYQEINSWHPTKANNKTSQKWQIPWSIPSKKYHELPPVPTVPTHPPCLDHHFESYPPGGRPGRVMDFRNLVAIHTAQKPRVWYSPQFPAWLTKWFGNSPTLPTEQSSHKTWCFEKRRFNDHYNVICCSQPWIRLGPFQSLTAAILGKVCTLSRSL